MKILINMNIRIRDDHMVEDAFEIAFFFSEIILMNDFALPSSDISALIGLQKRHEFQKVFLRTAWLHQTLLFFKLILRNPFILFVRKEKCDR